MTRYVAFLRGVSPTNAKMPELKRCFEAAGFSDVRTVLSSGNVVFGARPASEAALERRAEQAMHEALGKEFATFVRSAAYLESLVAADPYAAFELAPNAKRVVTFLRSTVPAGIDLPIERDGARILTATDRELFTAYVPSPKGPVFMNLLERTLGSEITTRTLDTVTRCARA
jgi:uncharacterized protein (DUF1697 family)